MSTGDHERRGRAKRGVEDSAHIALQIQCLDEEAEELSRKLGARRVSLYFIRLPLYAAAGLGVGLLVMPDPVRQELAAFAGAAALIGLVVEPSITFYRLSRLRRVKLARAALAREYVVP